METVRILAVALAVFSLLGGVACGEAATPMPTLTSGVGNLPPTLAAANPVPRSEVENAFDEPLSSGLSVADVVENALPSVVQIIADSGSGTGFIINESGLVVTNKHVVHGASKVTLRLASGGNFRGNVAERHPSLDLAYIEIDTERSFTPIAIGDSGTVRVGEDVIAIGFPLGSSLGQEPTVSVGIISARRNDRLQTDASLNPGNSGGPLLNIYGEAIGVVTSRVDSTDSGRAVSGIAFAIPINQVESGLGRQVSPSGTTLPTPTPTSFPAIGPTPDLQSTKSAIQTVDAHRRQAEQATRTASEAQQEAERYAASLEATRIAELPTPTPTVPPTPTPTPTPEPTPTPLPTPTPHPATYCEEWEAMVLEWIKQGNSYTGYFGINVDWRGTFIVPLPDHPELSASMANRYCITAFPSGILIKRGFFIEVEVGDKEGQLLPGNYEYRSAGGGKRVNERLCKLYTNYGDGEINIQLPHGETFTFQFFEYHGKVGLWHCDRYSALYRIGD